MPDSPERFPSQYCVQSQIARPLGLKQQPSTSSGLRLVLPPLKSVLAAKEAKKSKRRSDSTSLAPSPAVHDAEVVEKRLPRPVKLKPLKEVLGKLIFQIKKKDDYAFFLTPVDVKNVPGYLDVVKTPIDFGTISDKVNRGRYRSLEEFADDVKLVTTNAKIFNPPGSIYHQEAERIEAWSIDHINKAAGTVIQYEADWNIDIEKEDDAPTVNVDEEEDSRASPMDGDEQAPVRSGSVLSSQQLTMGRRGPRGPYRRQNQSGTNTLSESMEPDGRLPGSKDGVGAFPSGSAWASTMLSLKLKGKRYKTKKERMRIEKEGPPLLLNGSLDYTEMEDPFTVLSFFVPNPPTRPFLFPIYAPLSTIPACDTSSSQYASQDQSRKSVPPGSGESLAHPEPSHQPPPPSSYPATTSISFDHSPLNIDHIKCLTSSQPTSRRHWTISRNFNARQKGKDKDNDFDGLEFPSWQVPCEAHPTDFGSFALLAGELSEEMRRQGITPGTVQPSQEEQTHFDFIRDSLIIETPVQGTSVETKKVDVAGPQEQEEMVKSYWSAERVAEGESYIRDVVYGGESGLAYVRSLAEFIKSEQNPESDQEDAMDTEDIKPLAPNSTLEMPLATWVEQNVVDPLTDGQHGLIREAAMILDSPHTINLASNNLPHQTRSVREQVAKSLDLYPLANAALAALVSVNMHKIDMGALIKTPGELFVSEEEWYGKELKEKWKNRNENNAAKPNGSNGNMEGDEGAMEVEESAQTWVEVDANLPSPNGRRDADNELEGPEELKEVLDYSAAVILDLNKRGHLSSNSKNVGESIKGLQQNSEISTNGEGNEDPVLRHLRLNLLALAKRAPLDTIARLPKDLVPEHIRQYVPTLGAST